MIDYSLLICAAFALIMGMILLLYIVMPAPSNGNTAPPALGVEAYTGGGCVGKLLLLAVALALVAVFAGIANIKF